MHRFLDYRLIILTFGITVNKPGGTKFSNENAHMHRLLFIHQLDTIKRNAKTMNTKKNIRAKKIIICVKVQAVNILDHRWEDGPLRDNVKSTLLFSSEKGVNPGIWSWKNTTIWITFMSEIYQRYLFHKEMKSWDSTTWFRIWKFQNLGCKRYRQTDLLAEMWIFGGWWSGMSERDSQDLSNVVNTTPNIFLSLHLYSMRSMYIYFADKFWWCWCTHLEKLRLQHEIAFVSQSVFDTDMMVT
jgi:hypothetical protein